jgi:hypothetical protein
MWAFKFAAMFVCFLPVLHVSAETPWKRHAIETGMLGADGARLLDADGDGLLDVVTGWEQQGTVAVYFNPGPARCREPWPKIHFDKIRNVEDAAFVDLDGDGNIDVVSSCEGKTKTVYFHWAPSSTADYRDASKWTVQAVPATAGKEMWMFAHPIWMGPGRKAPDLIVGSKNKGGSVSWLEAPENPRDAAGWKLHRLVDAGWIMSIVVKDVNGDGRSDVLFSDRKGPNRGVWWLENPGDAAKPWPRHAIGGQGLEVMFLDVGDLDRDGLKDVVVAVKGDQLLYLRRLDNSGLRWESHSIAYPKDIGTGKAVTIGDINLDGKPDLVLTCEHAGEDAKGKSGVVWLSYDKSPFEATWVRHEISGPQGTKYDLAPLMDIDGDGDLDVITTEEHDNATRGNGGLGVIWYENPAK